MSFDIDFGSIWEPFNFIFFVFPRLNFEWISDCIFYRFWNKMVPKDDARAIPFCSLFRPCSAMGALGSALFIFEGPLVHFGFLLAPVLLFLVPFWFHFGKFPWERFICCQADVSFSTLFTSLSTLGLCALFDLICWHIVDSCGSLRVAFFVDLGTLGGPGILPDSHLAYLYIYIYICISSISELWLSFGFLSGFLSEDFPHFIASLIRAWSSYRFVIDFGMDFHVFGWVFRSRIHLARNLANLVFEQQYSVLRLKSRF